MKPAAGRDDRVAVPSLFEIFRGKLANGRRRIAEWRRQGFLTKEKLPQTRRRAMRGEALEPRLLLSADLIHTTPYDVALDASLRVEDVAGVAMLRLMDNQSDSVLEERALDDDIDVTIRGANRDDALRIDFDPGALAHQVRVNFEGGAGSDRITGPNRANTWVLNAPGTGALDDLVVTFSDVEELHGGASDDTFVLLDAAASVSIDGGEGNDTVVAADADNVWIISGENAGTLNGQSFANVEILSGGAGADTFVFSEEGTVTGAVRGGGGDDTLVAADQDNVWVISGEDAGTLNGVAFFEIENLRGGARADTFIFSGGRISGSIDGGEGINTLSYAPRSTDVTVNLEAGTATDIAALVNVTVVIGGGGRDTLIGRDADNTWTVTAQDAGTVGEVEFSGFEVLQGGAGSDRFVFQAGASVSGSVDGGAGDDTLVGASTANRWTIDDDRRGHAERQRASLGIENLLGGDGDDLFIFGIAGGLGGILSAGLGNDRVRGADRSNQWRVTGGGNATLNGVAFSGVEHVEGGAADDRLLGPDEDTVWIIDGPNAGEVAGMRFSGMETLEGAADNEDTFVFEQHGSLSGLIEGGARGFDSLEILGTYHTIVFTPTGPDSGFVDRDGDVIEYAGLEPVAGGTAEHVVFNGTAGDDDWVIEDSATPGEIQVRSTTGAIETTSFANPTTLTIHLGAGNDKITFAGYGDSGFSGTVIIHGGAGDDTYVFGDGWGTLEIVEADDEGTDTLDFTGHAGKLTVSADRSQITSEDGSTLSQSTVVADQVEEIDATLPNDTIAAIEAFLDELLAYIQNLQDGAGAVAQLFNQLPLIDGAADGSIAKLTGLTDAFTELVNKAKTELDGTEVKLSEVVGKLDGLLAPFGVFDELSLTVSTSYRGSAADAPDDTGALELLLDFVLHAAVQDQTFSLDLGEEGASLGVNISADVEVDAWLDAAFSIGISTHAPLAVFLVPGGSITLAVDAQADIGGSAINLGFLQLDVTTGTITLDGQVEIGFIDDAIADGRIDLSAPLGSITEITVSDPDPGDGYLEVSATVTVASGVKVGDNDLADAVITLEMGLAGDDPFGTATAASGPKITALTADLSGLTVPGPSDLDLLKFGNISPTEVMGMLGALLDTLVALAGSQFMQVPIPYTGRTVGQILDYGKSFKEDVLDPLFLSGNFLAPDANSDGIITLPFQDPNPELKVGSIQDLVAHLGANLGIPDLTASFDGGELTFTIDYFRAFGLGNGNVRTTTPGDGVTEEVQRLSYADAGVEAFRLVYRASDGSLEATDPIQVHNKTPGEIAADIDTKLEALLGMGNVSVVYDGLADGFHSYNINFAASLGNVAQLGFAGELPLNFGLSLGDFLGFSTSGTFGMAAVLDTSLTFGIDLNPDTVIRIVPPVFAPETPSPILTGDASFDVALYNLPAIGVETTINGSSSVNEVQKILLLNASGGTFKLAFGGHETSDIAFGADASAVEQALEDLVGIGSGNVTVAKAGDVYTVSFQGALANTNVAKLIADGKGLVNNAALGSLSVTVLAADTLDNADPEPAVAFGNLALDVQRAIDQALFDAGLTVGFDPAAASKAGWHTTGLITAGDTFTAAAEPFGGGAPSSDLAFSVSAGSSTFTGTVRAAKVAEVGLAAAIQAAVNTRIASTGISITVDTEAGGELTIQANGGNVELSFKSAIQAAAGGGRISLDAPLAKISFSDLEPALELQRRLEITVDYSDPAFQEMAIASVPTRFDGKIADDIDLTLKVNGTDVHLTLAAAVAAANTNLDQLVAQLQAALDTALGSAGFAAGDVIVKRLSINPDDPNSPKGNRIVFEGKAEVVTALSMFVPDSPTNGAITELGFDAGQGETKRSKAGSFFLEDVSFGGNFALFENGISATASLGPLAVVAEAEGTVDADTGKFFGADVNLALRSPLDAGTRVTIDEILNAINDKKFLFVEGEEGGTLADPATGFIDGSVGGGLGLTLTLSPAGLSIPGLPATLGELSISVESTNWLTSLPTPQIELDAGGLQELLESLKNLSFDDILAVLRMVVDMLRSLDGKDDGSPLAEVLGFKLPVIERSVSDLVNLSGEFLAFVDSLAANPGGSLQALETRLRTLLGLPELPSIEFPEILAFDLDLGTLYFNFDFSASANTVRPFNLDLADAGLGVFSQLVGLSASGNLGVQAAIDFALKLGLDLEGDDKAFFIDVDGTSLSATASAFGNNLEFEAALGPVGVFVINGNASLDGSFTVNLVDAGASSSDGRLILAGFGGSGLTSDLPSLLDFIDMDISGTGEVELPMFYGLKSSPAPMGSPNVLSATIDLVQMFQTPGTGFSLTLPNFDFNQLSLPSLFTLLSDPSVIVKGLNSVLKEVQGVLEGELFGFQLPLIGDALANNPVATFIEDFRLDFLQPLAKQLSESNLNLDGLIELVKDVISDVFGSLGILDTGPVHQFLDENGNPTNVFDAKALQFDFDLGNQIIETLATSTSTSASRCSRSTAIFLPPSRLTGTCTSASASTSTRASIS
jgi:hypothetical protein